MHPLKPHEEKILSHIYRYRMTTTRAVHRVFFATKEIAQAEHALRRLRRLDYVSPPRDLYRTSAGLETYFQLSARGAAYFGETEDLARPIQPQTLGKVYGVLAFCCLQTPLRHRLTLTEFQTSFSDLYRKGLPSANYYSDSVGERRVLGWIYVGYYAAEDRILQRCRAMLRQRQQIPMFRAMIEREEFAITVVTAHPAKKARLEERVAEKRLSCLFRATVVPELLFLL